MILGVATSTELRAISDDMEKIMVIIKKYAGAISMLTWAGSKL